MDASNEVKHLRYLAELAKTNADKRDMAVENILNNNYDLQNLLSWLMVCRIESSSDYYTLVASEPRWFVGRDSDSAHDTLKALQVYDNDHRTAVNALRDLAHLLIKYKNEVQKEYRPPEYKEPAWMKDA